MSATRFGIKLASLATALVWTAVACDDNPVDEGRDDSVLLSLNPSFVVVDAADTSRVNANAENRYGDPTLAGITFSACDSKISVEPDPTLEPIEPPDRAIVIGVTLGSSCVVVNSGGQTDTAEVEVVAAGVEVTSAPDTLRAGQTGEVVVRTIDKAGSPVGPFARTDATYTSSNDSSVALTDDMGSISTATAGFSEIEAVWSGGGLTRSASHTVVVIANVPASVGTMNSSVSPPIRSSIALK